MSETPDPAGNESPWLSDQAPCVYCGRVIPRTGDRCPHCRTSFSLAVRRASREVIGPWYYLDPRNPSGRGITFDTLVKMVEKGRIRPDSVVRGPTSHQDWMYAAETPRLAKYLGMCPHCFAEAKPEDTYCARCQLNMNERPAEVRPGVPPDIAKEPHHRAAYKTEEKLAEAVSSSEEALESAGSLDATPTPRSSEALRAAAAVFGEAATQPAERGGRAGLTSRRRRPSIWIVLAMTWVTLVPLVLLTIFSRVPLWVLPKGCEAGFLDWQSGLFGHGEPPVTPRPADDWVRQRLREADEAVREGYYAKAIGIYEDIIEKTRDTTWEANVQDLRNKMVEQRSQRLDRLREHLTLAEDLAKEHRYDDALARLRNIGKEDRELIASSVGVSVEKMETEFRADGDRWRRQQQEEQRKRLIAQLERAKALRDNKALEDALNLYKEIVATFPAELVSRHIKIDEEIRQLEATLALAKPPAPPAPQVSGEEIAAKIADLLGQAAALEKEEKFAEVLQKLQEIKKFDRKYWPDLLEKRISDVEAKKEALDFFGINGG